MSSILDNIRVICSPKTTKALFINGMSWKEKSRIRSAMDAIESSKRPEVADLTHRVLWGHCYSSGRDKIVTAVAATNLSPDNWSDLISQVGYAAQWVHDGADMAEIILAVAALPKEKREFCNKASFLFKMEMRVQERILIINAFNTIKPDEISEIFDQTNVLINGLNRTPAKSSHKLLISAKVRLGLLSN